MVDVHILTMPGMNMDWFEACLRSLKDEPVTVHICQGILGDTAKARTEAFKRGKEKYVAFVDPDDEVIPGTFAKLVNLLESDENAVMAFSDEALMDQDGGFLGFGWSKYAQAFVTAGYDIRIHNVKGQYIHHLRVMRRDMVEKCLPLKTKRMPEPVLMHDLAKLGGLLHLKELGYKWRIHDANTFASYSDAEKEEALSWCV